MSVPQVNVNTRSNYQAIEHVTAAAQENSAGAKAIEDMVVRIRTFIMAQLSRQKSEIFIMN